MGMLVAFAYVIIGVLFIPIVNRVMGIKVPVDNIHIVVFFWPLLVLVGLLFLICAPFIYISYKTREKKNANR